MTVKFCIAIGRLRGRTVLDHVIFAVHSSVRENIDRSSGIVVCQVGHDTREGTFLQRREYVDQYLYDIGTKQFIGLAVLRYRVSSIWWKLQGERYSFFLIASVVTCAECFCVKIDRTFIYTFV